MSFLTLILLIHINSGLVLSYGLEEMDYLFAEPDYDIREIQLKFRQLCGYRYRPYIRTVEYKAKCFAKGLSNGRPTDVRNITEVYKPSESLRAKSRVLHGTVAAKHESPWTVQLAYIDHFHGYFRSYMYSCTGVLITPRHILTAAHCHKESGQLALFVGNNKAFDDRYYIGEKYSFLRHPNYKTNDPNSPITKYDIGIIVLDKPIEPVVVWTNTLDSVVTTICLPKANILIGHFEYRSATFFGWGDIGDGPTSPQELRRADVMVKNSQLSGCPIGFCFMSKWSAGKTTSCQGDSGSGLIQYLDKGRTRAVLIGILSRVNLYNSTSTACSEGSAQETIFISVHHHLSWIKQVVRNTTSTVFF